MTATDLEDEADRELLGFVVGSQYRVRALEVLSESDATPAGIANDDHQTSQISRALCQLRERDLVELLVPEERMKGRVYRITDRGERIYDHAGDVTR